MVNSVDPTLRVGMMSNATRSVATTQRSVATTLARTIASGLRAARVAAPRSISEFIERELVIPDGLAKNQRFSFDRQPVVRLWFEAIDSGRFTEYVFTGPSQSGKTLSGFVAPLVYHTCEVEENYVLGLPHGDMAANKWEADIQPVLRASVKMRRLMPRRGSGSGGGRVRDSITLGNNVIIKLTSAGGGGCFGDRPEHARSSAFAMQHRFAAPGVQFTAQRAAGAIATAGGAMLAAVIDDLQVQVAPALLGEQLFQVPFGPLDT